MMGVRPRLSANGPRPRPRLAPFTVAGALLLATMSPTVLDPTGLSAQQPTLAELTATPEETVDLFLRSVRATRWSAAAQFVHPRTLDRFHRVVTMISEADTTGDVRDFLTGTDSSGYAALDPREVFVRSLDVMIADMPGLRHAVFDRNDEILGHVAEGADTAHVVYRTTARISGGVPEMKVMQLARTPDGWRVVWSDELEVLDAALRGIARSRTPRLPGGGARPGAAPQPDHPGDVLLRRVRPPSPPGRPPRPRPPRDTGRKGSGASPRPSRPTDTKRLRRVTSCVGRGAYGKRPPRGGHHTVPATEAGARSTEPPGRKDPTMSVPLQMPRTLFLALAAAASVASAGPLAAHAGSTARLAGAVGVSVFLAEVLNAPDALNIVTFTLTQGSVAAFLADR